MYASLYRKVMIFWQIFSNIANDELKHGFFLSWYYPMRAVLMVLVTQELEVISAKNKTIFSAEIKTVFQEVSWEKNCGAYGFFSPAFLNLLCFKDEWCV